MKTTKRRDNRKDNRTTPKGIAPKGTSKSKTNHKRSLQSRDNQSRGAQKRDGQSRGVENRGIQRRVQRRAAQSNDARNRDAFNSDSQIRGDILYGRNPVMEVLKSGKQIEKIMLQDGARNSCGKILTLAKDKGVRVDYTNKLTLDKMTGGATHQGILCIVSQHEYAELEDVLAKVNARIKDESGINTDALDETNDGNSKGNSNSVMVLLDGIEDPHNLGAIMRSAECSGADAVIIPKRRSVGLTETVAKTSAGAIEYMPCVKVNNLVAAIDTLKENGYWICAADMDGESLWTSKLTGKIAIVIGNEGKGVSRLVREKCDFIVSIPMTGRISSLNASNAAAVILYEALRQRMN